MGPFIKSNNKTNKVMLNLLIALIPLIIFAIYKNGYIPYSKGEVGIYGLIYPFIFIIIGSLTSLVVEGLYAFIFKKKDYLKHSYSFFTGLFLSLILPLNTPLLFLILGTIFATIFGRLIFGGFGKNQFNPSLIGYIFVVAICAIFVGVGSFDNYQVSKVDKDTSNIEINPYTSLYDSFMGKTSVSLDSISPFTNITGNFSSFGGSLGVSSSLLCLLAFAYLAITKTIKWKIPFVYILTVFIINSIISRLLGAGVYYPLFSILSGGLLFGSIFLATESVTSPVTNFGQIMYGLFLGIITVLLRYLGFEAIATSILIMSIFVFLLDEIGAKVKINLSKSVVLVLVVFVLIIATGIYIACQEKGNNLCYVESSYLV